MESIWRKQYGLASAPFVNGPINDEGGTWPRSIRRELDGYSIGRGSFEKFVPPLFMRPLLFVRFYLRAYLYPGENPNYRWDAPGSQN